MSDDVGTVADAELARNKIFLTANDLKLYVEGVTYELPRWYSAVPRKDLYGHLARNDEARNAILNDGHNPVQLRVLAENRRQLEEEIKKYEARQKILGEEELWCGWVNPEK